MRRHTRTDNKIELKILEHPSEMWYKVRFRFLRHFGDFTRF